MSKTNNWIERKELTLQNRPDEISRLREQIMEQFPEAIECRIINILK